MGEEESAKELFLRRASCHRKIKPPTICRHHQRNDLPSSVRTTDSKLPSNTSVHDEDDDFHHRKKKKQRRQVDNTTTQGVLRDITGKGWNSFCIERNAKSKDRKKVKMGILVLLVCLCAFCCFCVF